jgi:hypothetical protein
VALHQTLLDVLSEPGNIFLRRVDKERLEADMRIVIVGEAELVQYAQLIVVFEDDGGLTRWSAQRLLFLYVVGELTQSLSRAVSLAAAPYSIPTYRLALPPLLRGLSRFVP